MRYSEFNIIEFRNIKNVKIKVKEGLNPIIGINDSGKSSILEAIDTFHESLYLDRNVVSKRIEDFQIEAIITELTQSELSGIFRILVKNNTSEDDGEILINPYPTKYLPSMYFKIVKHYEDGAAKLSKVILYDDDQCIQCAPLNNTIPDSFDIDGNDFPNINHFDDFSSEPVSVIYDNEHDFPTNKERELNHMYWKIGDEKQLLYTIFTKIPMWAHNREKGLQELGKLITDEFDKLSKRLSQPHEKILFKAFFRENEEGSYVEIKGFENGKEFNLSERSSGFRWSYNMMLFTRFNPYINGLHKRGLILLDEPETHLHESIQSELLDYLMKLSDINDIVMATHSSHLLNPNKIDFKDIQIVKKENGLIKLNSYDEVSGSKLNALMPVYTALQLDEFSELAYGKYIVVVEGKMDRYALQLFCGLDDRFAIWDCSSASNIGGKPTKDGIDKNVTILSRRNFNFMVLADYDDEGIKAVKDTKESLKEEYSEEWITKRIKNYNNFCKLSFDEQNGEKIKKNERVVLETVFGEDKKLIIDIIFDCYNLNKKNERKYNKKEFRDALEALFYKDKDRALTKKIVHEFSKKTKKCLYAIKCGIYEAFEIKYPMITVRIKNQSKH